VSTPTLVSHHDSSTLSQVRKNFATLGAPRDCRQCIRRAVGRLAARHPGCNGTPDWRCTSASRRQSLRVLLARRDGGANQMWQDDLEIEVQKSRCSRADSA